MIALALAAPVVAGVMQPEVTAGRDPRAGASDVGRATEPPSPPARMTPVVSPDGVLREQRVAAVAREEARQEAREAGERREARRERLRELAEERAIRREEARERRERGAQAAQTAPISFRIGTLNLLGGAPATADGSTLPPAPLRTAEAAGLVASHGVDVLGTQEVPADQLRDLLDRTGMAAWPEGGWGESETGNTILYDPGVFEVVDGSFFTITVMGHPRPQPVVRLRHRATGRELFVVDTHPPAGEGRSLAERRRGEATLVGVVEELSKAGLPVLVTGDMNDGEEFYCRVVPAAGLVASNGGGGGGPGTGCRPPEGPLPVDWVVGTARTWSEYRRDLTRERTGGHHFVSAQASFD